MFRYASLLLSSAGRRMWSHDLLMRLWSEHARWEMPRKVEPFVMTAVRNRCCDLLRQ